MIADYYVLEIRSIYYKDTELLKEQCNDRIEILKSRLNTTSYSRFLRILREMNNINQLKETLYKEIEKWLFLKDF